MNLKGKLDNYAPINISGKLNPLLDELYADVLLRLEGLNMTSFSTYSGTYAGKEIEKGKLHLDVSYLIKKQKLNAQNEVFIDQFYFGKDVDSDQATSLPVGLGVSLLKNQRGEIDIDLPIEGDLSDPDFRYGSIVWGALGNIIVKAAASPFKLLAGLVETGEDLSQINFTASAAALSPEEIEKLKAN